MEDQVAENNEQYGSILQTTLNSQKVKTDPLQNRVCVCV